MSGYRAVVPAILEAEAEGISEVSQSYTVTVKKQHESRSETISGKLTLVLTFSHTY